MTEQPGNRRRRGTIVSALPTGDRLKRIKRMYDANEVTVAEVCRRCQITDYDLRLLIELHKWTTRSRMTKPRVSSLRKVLPKRRTEAQVRADNQAAEDARRRGFPIDRIGINPRSDGVRFGNSVISFNQLREKADRERRLELGARMVQA